MEAAENDTAYGTLSSLEGGIDIPVPISDHHNLLHVFTVGSGSERTPERGLTARPPHAACPRTT
ncbi:hypothetical protein ACIQZB_32695 [Streptomyces sp. NPDC097727]|uniref:hypothetical protein n=1 Tax=Streptomyces sp. NPDC097727 TaxID=3366092 RepID=UPI0037F4DD83